MTAGVRALFLQPGREWDDDRHSEAIQTVRKAQELLDKLSSYEPLAKVEEVDNVLNNGATGEQVSFRI